MSQQLTLSSLFSALAMVLLVLLARVDAVDIAGGNASASVSGPLAVEIHTPAELNQ